MSGNARFPIEKHEMSVTNELPPGMPVPKAPGDQHMGGVKKEGHYSGGHEHDGHGHEHGMAMHAGRAVKHLEHQMERHHEHEKHGRKY